MKTTESNPQIERALNSGWAVHVYDQKRQLLCTLGPSHGWSFAAGTAMGLLMAVVGFNLSNSRLSERPMLDNTTPHTAPLQVD